MLLYTNRYYLIYIICPCHDQRNVFIIDFGSVSVEGDVPPMTCQQYCPPDSVVTLAWDVFSLGVVFSEMFRLDPVQAAHIAQQNPAFHGGLERLMSRMCSCLISFWSAKFAGMFLCTARRIWETLFVVTIGVLVTSRAFSQIPGVNDDTSILISLSQGKSSHCFLFFIWTIK